MKKRKIIIIAGVLLVAAAIFVTQWLAGRNQEDSSQQQSASQTSATVVSTRQVNVQDVQSYVDITGRLEPEDKIDIYAEVGGVLLPTKPAFKVGNRFRRGTPLVRINDSEARQNLRAQKSNYITTLASVVPDLKIDFPDAYQTWENYLLSFSVDEPVPPLPDPLSEQLRLFLGARNVYTQYYTLRQLEEQLDKYRIYAPFTGTLTEASINQGTLIRQGQKLGEFIKDDVYEMEAAVRPEELAFIAVGDEVELSSVPSDSSWQGTIVRINERVEPASQTVKVFVRVDGDALKAGMYLEGRVRGRLYENAFEIPRDVLVNENKVFIVQDSTAELLTVETLKTSDEIAIVRGLEDGMTLITEDNTEAFSGTKVASEQSSQPSSSASPQTSSSL